MIHLTIYVRPWTSKLNSKSYFIVRKLPPRCHLLNSASTAQTKVQTQIVEQLQQQLYKVEIQTNKGSMFMMHIQCTQNYTAVNYCICRSSSVCLPWWITWRRSSSGRKRRRGRRFRTLQDHSSVSHYPPQHPLAGNTVTCAATHPLIAFTSHK